MKFPSPLKLFVKLKFSINSNFLYFEFSIKFEFLVQLEFSINLDFTSWFCILEYALLYPLTISSSYYNMGKQDKILVKMFNGSMVILTV